MGRITFLVFLALAVAACDRVSESRLNPMNWFGAGQEEPAAAVVQTVPVDPALTDERPLVGLVTTLVIERAAGGAIVRATGLAPRQGYHGAELVPVAGETPVNGALVYFFRVETPEGPTAQGPDRTRTLSVARFVSDDTLASARNIVVRAASNQRRASR